MDSADTGRSGRRRLDVTFVVAGLGLLAIGMVLVRDGEVADVEREAFAAVNGLPEGLYAVLFPFQQMGALLVGPLVAAVAAATRRFRLAGALLLATVMKLVTERVVKALVSRQRPGTSIGDEVIARGDVSLRGESFVSGHAVLVTALAVLVLPHLRGRWKLVLVPVVLLVLVGRVYVGAHAPLDVICGAGLGAAIGGALDLLVRPPVRAARS